VLSRWTIKPIIQDTRNHEPKMFSFIQRTIYLLPSEQIMLTGLSDVISRFYGGLCYKTLTKQ
jgi:hypothetical protein